MPKGANGREGWMYNDYHMVLAEGDIVFYTVDCPCREMGIATIWRWETGITVDQEQNFRDNSSNPYNPR
jgi:hypothetical protein